MPTLNEFFDRDGRFTHLVNTLPPHAILNDDNAMDTDEYGIKPCLPSYTPQELEDTYDNDVLGYSQPLW